MHLETADACSTTLPSSIIGGLNAHSRKVGGMCNLCGFHCQSLGYEGVEMIDFPTTIIIN